MRHACLLAAVAGSVPVARVAARDFATEYLPARVRDLETIVSELVTNVVRHARVKPGDRVRLVLERRGPAVRVSVRDQGSGFEEPPPAPGPNQTSGWGLHLVDQLSDRWGYARQGDGFVVWAEVRSGDGANGRGG